MAESHENRKEQETITSSSDTPVYTAKNFKSSERIPRDHSPLYNVLRRRKSLTIPSKRFSKLTTMSKKMKKRVSMPDFEQGSTAQLPYFSESHERPLPPSPPPSLDDTSECKLGETESLCHLPEESQGPHKTEHYVLDLHNSNICEGDTSTTERADGDFNNQSKEELKMQLKDVLRKFNNHFPLRVKFVEGYCSEDSEHNLSANEMYDIHFIKKTKVINFKDKDGFIHQIPLTSAAMFGLVYNPLGDYDQALDGYTFEKCSDIMAADPMPTILCATNQVKSMDEQHGIAQNEILLVRGVQKPKIRGKRLLKVFSVLSNAGKLLPEQCQGEFTTKPSLVRLHLSQIVSNISNPFPAQAVLYTDKLEASMKLGFPQTGVITLCECIIETSLVSSPIGGDHSHDPSNDDYVTLHLNEDMMNLEIEVISWKESAQSQVDQTPESVLDYDDVIVVHKKPVPSESEEYDDILPVCRKEVSDDETYATVGMYHETTSEHKEGVSIDYDKVPVEIPMKTNEALQQ